MRQLLRLLVWVLVIGAILVGLARLVAIRWWRVPDDDAYLDASIAPSVRGGDLVLLWRLTTPGYGALVRCPEPKHPERWVVGRILGEEGDRVRIQGSRVEVNNKRSDVERSCEHFSVKDPRTGSQVEQRCALEAIGSVSYLVGSAIDGHDAPETEAQPVPPGSVFLVSDNRQFPYDSRDYGLAPRSSCTETIFFRLAGKEGFSDPETRFSYVR